MHLSPAIVVSKWMKVHKSSCAYSEPVQIPKMELLGKIVFKSFTIFAKISIVDVCQGSENAYGAHSSFLVVK